MVLFCSPAFLRVFIESRLSCKAFGFNGSLKLIVPAQQSGTNAVAVRKAMHHHLGPWCLTSSVSTDAIRATHIYAVGMTPIIMVAYIIIVCLSSALCILFNHSH